MILSRKILFFFIIVNESLQLFNNPLKKLKLKAKNYYKQKFGNNNKEKLHFLGHDLTEYPGTNLQYRQINQDKWNEYYMCLLLNENKTELKSEAIIGFESKSIKLECKLCLSPLERDKLNNIEWYWASKTHLNLNSIEYTEHILLEPETKTLHIYNLNMEHTGQYLCKMGETETAPIFLTVINTPDNQLDQVHLHIPKTNGPYPKQMEFIHNLILDTKWDEWSQCTKCGQVGKKFKLGYCTIKLNPSKTSNLTNLDVQIFQIFHLGIPCDSHILPSKFKQLEQVKNRKNEVLSAFCKEKCPPIEIFEVKDKNGKIIETANNSAGIYSMLQGIPPAHPTIERRLEYGSKGEEIVLTCPGNLNSDIPVQWQIGSKKIVPHLIEQESMGRIYISLTDKIHIKNMKLHDSSIYSCWQRSELAGTIRLIVEEKFKMNFNHHIMLFGIVVILSVFLYVFIKAFTGRKYAKNQ